MHHDFIDRYSRIASPVHRIPAGVKMACFVLLLLAVILIPSSHTIWYAVIAAALLVVAGLSRIPVSFLGGRLLMLEPFVVGIAILSLLQPGGLPIFLRLVIRGTLCLFTVILLSNTTPFPEMLKVMRRIRIPSLLVTTIALMYRYIFVLVDETERMTRARASRTFRHERSHIWRTRANAVGQLFIRSTGRAERIYSAMCARGWKT
jgi:cobalt/nickel transport system permease protein